jgi:sec-independent protein translocase protein TatB
MFGIGFQELLLIFIIALVVVGPNKLPELAKTLGKGLAEFKRATNDIKQSFDQDETVREIKQEFHSAQSLALLQDRLPPPATTANPTSEPSAGSGEANSPPSDSSAVNAGPDAEVSGSTSIKHDDEVDQEQDQPPASPDATTT